MIAVCAPSMNIVISGWANTMTPAEMSAPKTAVVSIAARMPFLMRWCLPAP